MFRSLFQPARPSSDRRHRVHLELIRLDDRTTPAVTGAAVLAPAAGGLSLAAVRQPAVTSAGAAALVNPTATQDAGSSSSLAALGSTFASGATFDSTTNGQLVPRNAGGTALSPDAAGLFETAAAGVDTGLGATALTVPAGLDNGPGARGLPVPAGLITMPGAGMLMTGVVNLADFGTAAGNPGVTTPAAPVAPTLPATDFVGASAGMVVGTNEAIGLGAVSGTGVAQSYVPGQAAGVGGNPVFVNGASEFDGLGTVGAL